jgi:hypothetical protein
MNLGDLLDRAFDILGDERADPEYFVRDDLVDLMNEGCMIFRREVEDEWYRQDVPAVAGTAIYDYPDVNVRGMRIAFDDVTMVPTSVQQLQVIDSRWETRDSEHPRRFTSQGLPHNQWRAYPYPNNSTDGQITWNGGNDGIANRVVEGAVTATPVADPLSAFDPRPPDPPEWFGMMNRVYNSGNDPNILGTKGRIGYSEQTNTKQFTVWGVKKAAIMSSDVDAVPLKNAFQIAPLWYALSESYEEEGDRHNPILAAYYRDRFRDAMVRGRSRANDPAPFMVHVLRPNSRLDYTGEASSPWPSEVVIDGVSQNAGFPRRGFWGV